MTSETLRLGQPNLIPRPAAARSVPRPTGIAGSQLYGLNSRDLRSRAFNLMRTRLLTIAQTEKWRSFGITSPAPGAGKSFIASNLAAALTRAPDYETYLFDLDLRRGSVAEYFALEVDAGLEQFLAGELPDLHSVARRIDEESLVVAPCRASGRSTAELVAGAPMKRLVAATRDHPVDSIFIFDLPPVFANDDAAAVASMLDAYLLVVEEGKTNKQQIRDCMNLMAPAICAGTILNRHKTGLFDDSYGYGRTQAAVYGSYYTDE